MAKRFLISGLIFALMMSMAAPAYCDDMFKKLGRGFCNIITCPMELVHQPSRVNNTDGPAAAATYGLLKGVAQTFMRLVVGVYEIATFPVPIPKDYKPIMSDPEFFFESENW